MQPAAAQSDATRDAATSTIERAYFRIALVLGKLLRSSTYSKVRVVVRDGQREVRKRRSFYAPFLVWLGEPLMKVLDTGVSVLAQREWVNRERQLYAELYREQVHVYVDGTLVLPVLPGTTLADLLENSALDEHTRTESITCAVAALAEFHGRGFTHGDAMAENVLVHVESYRAHWFDFETQHDVRRPVEWRRADDLRALLATCLLRTRTAQFAPTLNLILDTYRDDNVSRLLAPMFRSALQRPLPYYLGQASLSHAAFQEIGRLLDERRRLTPA